MLQDPKYDKVIETKVYEQEMFVTCNGKKYPTKGKVTETIYESGRKDTHVEVDKPLAMLGESKE